MNLRTTLGLLTLGGILWAAAVGAGESRSQDVPEEIAALNRRFTAGKPTVVMEYASAYRFLFLEFKGIAAVRIALTEGFWEADEGRKMVPACRLDFRVFDPKARLFLGGIECTLEKINVKDCSSPINRPDMGD